MTTHDDFLQKQISAQLREAKYDEAVAISSAMAAVDHQRCNPRLKLPELLAWAKTHAKHSKRVKGKPVSKPASNAAVQKWRSN